jgi:N-acetylmuramoyl-L-alanine amidase
MTHLAARSLTRRALLARAAALALAPALVRPAALGAAPVDAVAPRRRVGLQAGHWLAADMPPELARFRAQTGTQGGGVAEWELNLDVARRAATLLEEQGIDVDVLPATVPPGYRADVFLALHADGDPAGRLSGFKAARYRASALPELDDALVGTIEREYGLATGLSIDPHVSRNMLGYYAFSRRLTHAIAPTTPAAILELGFMTSGVDLRTLLGRRDAVATGVARAVLRFLTGNAVALAALGESAPTFVGPP